MPHHRLRLRQSQQFRGQSGHHPHHRQQIGALAKVLTGIEGNCLDRPAKTVWQAIVVANGGEHFSRAGRQADQIIGEAKAEKFQPIRLASGSMAHRKGQRGPGRRIGKTTDIFRRGPMARRKQQRQALLEPR